MIRQLLSWKELFKEIINQEGCLLVEDPTEHYLKMKQTKIGLKQIDHITAKKDLEKNVVNVC